MNKTDEMCLNFVHLLFARTEQEFCKYYPKHRGRGCWKIINRPIQVICKPEKEEAK